MAGIKMARPDGDHAIVVKADQWKKAVQGYLAAIAFLDAQVGRLLDALDKGPIKDNTIIVFWGDHGWHLGEKQHWRKFALWEEATRAPLIVVAPGVAKAESKCDTPVDYMSFYPTLCDLCGLKTPEHVEGRSLRPLLVNPSARWEHAALTTHGLGNHAVRLGQWRYIRYADGSEELYDHTNDPLEWKNLAKDEKYNVKKAELAKHLPAKEEKNAPRMK
jgi:arylsulfatase A-like enzyme